MRGGDSAEDWRTPDGLFFLIHIKSNVGTKYQISMISFSNPNPRRRRRRRQLEDPSHNYASPSLLPPRQLLLHPLYSSPFRVSHGKIELDPILIDMGAARNDSRTVHLAVSRRCAWCCQSHCGVGVGVVVPATSESADSGERLVVGISVLRRLFRPSVLAARGVTQRKVDDVVVQQRQRR
jgi:hypothetical protein